MILGLESQVAARCFEEINEAVWHLIPSEEQRFAGELLWRKKYRVVFNAHAFSNLLQPNDVVFNLENVPGQVPFDAYEFEGMWGKHKVWDFSYATSRAVGSTHVPIGYHVSMERFEPLPYSERDVDIVFTGHPNERRQFVIDKLLEKGLRVVQLGHGCYGRDRDRLLARSKLALNMLYYEDGTFPTLRVAHLVANRVPVLSEVCPEGWEFVPTCGYNDLARVAHAMVTRRREYLDHLAQSAYTSFRMNPLRLPEMDAG